MDDERKPDIQLYEYMGKPTRNVLGVWTKQIKSPPIWYPKWDWLFWLPRIWIFKWAFHVIDTSSGSIFVSEREENNGDKRLRAPRE